MPLRPLFEISSVYTNRVAFMTSVTLGMNFVELPDRQYRLQYSTHGICSLPNEHHYRRASNLTVRASPYSVQEQLILTASRRSQRNSLQFAADSAQQGRICKCSLQGMQSPDVEQPSLPAQHRAECLIYNRHLISHEGIVSLSTCLEKADSRSMASP